MVARTFSNEMKQILTFPHKTRLYLLFVVCFFSQITKSYHLAKNEQKTFFFCFLTHLCRISYVLNEWKRHPAISNHQPSLIFLCTQLNRVSEWREQKKNTYKSGKEGKKHRIALYCKKALKPSTNSRSRMFCFLSSHFIVRFRLSAVATTYEKTYFRLVQDANRFVSSFFLSFSLGLLLFASSNGMLTFRPLAILCSLLWLVWVFILKTSLLKLSEKKNP